MQDALAIISREACSGISAKSIADRLGVSRRLLDIRFSELQGQSATMALRDARIAEAKRLLIETSVPFGELARRCGYGGVDGLNKAFRTACGVSMHKFRNASRSSGQKIGAGD